MTEEQRPEAAETPAAESAPPASPDAVRPEAAVAALANVDATRFYKRPGFVLGIVFGFGGLALIGLCGVVAAGVLAFATTSRIEAMPTQEITLSPTSAGEQQWFEIGDDGTGTLKGWSYGSYGDTDSEHAEYEFEVYGVGEVDGLPVRHAMMIGVTDATEFYMGSERIKAKKGKRSAADTIFDMESEGPTATLLDDEYELTVEFVRKDDELVATKVTADPNGQTSPMMY